MAQAREADMGWMVLRVLLISIVLMAVWTGVVLWL